MALKIATLLFMFERNVVTGYGRFRLIWSKFWLWDCIAGTGNIGNIPLVIVGAICREKGNPFEEPETCNTNAVAYISFGQWVCNLTSLLRLRSCGAPLNLNLEYCLKVGAVIVYTYVYSMLAPPVRPAKELGSSTSSSDLVGNQPDQVDSESRDHSEETAVTIPLIVPEAPPAAPQVRQLLVVTLVSLKGPC